MKIEEESFKQIMSAWLMFILSTLVIGLLIIEARKTELKAICPCQTKTEDKK